MTQQTTLNFYFGEAGPSNSTSQGRGQKRPAVCPDPGASKHRKSGIDPSWMDDFLWLELREDDIGETGMWCSLCRANNCRPKRAPLGKTAWIEVPCKTITRQGLREQC